MTTPGLVAVTCAVLAVLSNVEVLACRAVVRKELPLLLHVYLVNLVADACQLCEANLLQILFASAAHVISCHPQS